MLQNRYREYYMIAINFQNVRIVSFRGRVEAILGFWKNWTILNYEYLIMDLLWTNKAFNPNFRYLVQVSACTMEVHMRYHCSWKHAKKGNVDPTSQNGNISFLYQATPCVKIGTENVHWISFLLEIKVNLKM